MFSGLMELKTTKNLRALNTFVLCNCFQNCAQSSETKILMSRDCHSLMGWGVCFKNDVTSYLVHDRIAPISAKEVRQIGFAQVARNFYPFAKTSSRVR